MWDRDVCAKGKICRLTEDAGRTQKKAADHEGPLLDSDFTDFYGAGGQLARASTIK
jgi:hypothetical protein